MILLMSTQANESSFLGRKMISKERKELKYYIRNETYLLLKNRLKFIMKKDKYAVKEEGYKIRSLYFDTLANRHFYEKQYGVEARQKIRLRIYPPDSTNINFEIKSKFNEMINKETAKITKKDAIEIQNCNFECLLKYENPVLNKAYKILKTDIFKPVAIIDYLRDAYVSEINHARITFDKVLSTNTTNLNLFIPHTTMSRIIDNNLVIMEVKYNGFLPKFIKDSIQIPSFMRSSISKYFMGRIE
ncbi:MAG: polyphosphate polymerase domain-containing protein [Nanoarchaeota archaeon]|nr:polyphosphate polymerase domain-containing protein [Nanoarchaeota archaeon]